MNLRSKAIRHLPMAVFAAVISVLTLPAIGHGGATGIIKKRMDAMSEMGKANKALRAMVKGTRATDGAEVRELGLRLRAHARELPALFPDTPPSP